jgi:hypothetical protein
VTRHRRALLAIIAWIAGSAASGCHDPTASIDSEQWAADLVASRQVLFLSLLRSGSTMSGSATLSGLLEPGGSDRLSVTGTNRGDTLDILMSRASGGQYHLLAIYGSNRARLSGTLNGGEFTNLAVSFRKP